MSATEGMQTYSSDASNKQRNSMTAYNIRNASNIRNESNSRTANTVGTPAKAGMLAKLMKQQNAGRLTTAGTLLTSEMTAAAGTIYLGTSWMSTAAGPQESDSRKVSNCREDSNIQQQLEHITLATAAKTIGGHRRQQQKKDPQLQRCQK
jgi:hypothetical protein